MRLRIFRETPSQSHLRLGSHCLKSPTAIPSTLQSSDATLVHSMKVDPPGGIMHKRVIYLTLLVFVCFTTLYGQSAPPANTKVTAGWTPLAQQPGSPAGSYPLSGFDTVNLFNGHLNFRLPLMQIGGRGRAGYTMTLPIEQKWQVVTVAVPTCNQSGCSYPTGNYKYI